jgi:integrase
MTGHIRRRGKGSWEIKFDLGRDPATGKRRIRYQTFKGTKRAAEIEAAKMIAAARTGLDIDPSRITVSEFLDRWEKDWAAGNVSPKTLERYTELLGHVRRKLGVQALQKLRPAMLSELYAELQRSGKASKRKGGEPSGLSARTVGHVHRVLHRAVGHAAQWGLVAANVVDLVDPPRVVSREIVIVKADAVGPLLTRLRTDPIYPIAALALGTGMRRGELLALRWEDIDFAKATLRVERSLESTKAGLRFKAPKTKYGRRTITLPATVITELRGVWKAQQEQRLALGLGKAPEDALAFADLNGDPLDPDSISKAFKSAAKAAGAPPALTLHGLRHTHASALIAAGVDVLTISRRLGHGSPAITLAVYGHLFVNSDDRSAAIAEVAFANMGTE